MLLLAVPLAPLAARSFATSAGLTRSFPATARSSVRTFHLLSASCASLVARLFTLPAGGLGVAPPPSPPPAPPPAPPAVLRVATPLRCIMLADSRLLPELADLGNATKLPEVEAGLVLICAFLLAALGMDGPTERFILTPGFG